MWTWTFWKDAIERAVKTFAQAVISLTVVVGSEAGFELLEINWIPVITVGLVASVLSILMSLASSLKGNTDSASLVK